MGEMKRRSMLRELRAKQTGTPVRADKRRSTADKDKENKDIEEEMGLGGATADDFEAEAAQHMCERELLAPTALLGVAARLVDYCVEHTRQLGVQVCVAAASAMAKLMLVRCLTL